MSEPIKTQQFPHRFMLQVATARKYTQDIFVADIVKMQTEQTDFFLFDVRELPEWKQANIPGSMHMSRGVIDRDIFKQAPALDSLIVVYSQHGYRAALVARSLMDLGYPNVYSMRGGLNAWIEAEHPIKSA